MESLLTIGLIFQAIGTILLLGGYAPQIIKLHRTHIPTGISLLFWTMIGSGCTLILANMVIQGTSTPVVVTQALNTMGAWYTLGLVMYCRNKVGEAIVIPNYSKFVVLIIVAVIGSGYLSLEFKEFGNALQLLGTFALLTAYIPQIIYLHKVKDASGISKWLFLILAHGLLFVTANMIITQTSIWIIITEFVNVALILVLMFMTVHYQLQKIKQLS